jgi:hypothetical protein
MTKLYWIEFTHVGVTSICPQMGKVEKSDSDFVPGTSPQDAFNNLLIRLRNHATINVHTVAERQVKEVTLDNCETFDLDPECFEAERGIANDA